VIAAFNTSNDARPDDGERHFVATREAALQLIR
jgi:hypothetical protein